MSHARQSIVRRQTLSFPARLTSSEADFNTLTPISFSHPLSWRVERRSRIEKMCVIVITGLAVTLF